MYCLEPAQSWGSLTDRQSMDSQWSRRFDISEPDQAFSKLGISKSHLQLWKLLAKETEIAVQMPKLRIFVQITTKTSAIPCSSSCNCKLGICESGQTAARSHPLSKPCHPIPFEAARPTGGMGRQKGCRHEHAPKRNPAPRFSVRVKPAYQSRI